MTDHDTVGRSDDEHLADSASPGSVETDERHRRIESETEFVHHLTSLGVRNVAVEFKSFRGVVRLMRSSFLPDGRVDLLAIGSEDSSEPTAMALVSRTALEQISRALQQTADATNRQLRLPWGPLHEMHELTGLMFDPPVGALHGTSADLANAMSSIVGWLHMASAASASAQIAEAFGEGLSGLADVAGLDDDDVVPSEVLEQARAAGARFVAAQRWAQITGDSVDTATLRERLGISRQALNQRVNAGTLVGLPGATTTWFPLWQFRTVADSDRLEVRPVVGLVLQQFRDQLGDGVRPQTIVSWAATDQPELGMTPRTWIGQDNDDEPVVAAAARAAALLAQ